MRIFIGLLALALITNIESVSVSTRSNNWKVGETYVYKYQTTQLSSIPLLSNEHTGVSIWTDVSLFVQTADTLVMKLDHPVLRVLTSEGERSALPPSKTVKLHYSDDRVYKPLDQEVEKRFTEELKKTIKFTINGDQVIGDIWVDETDSIPSVDIKKGFINLLQVQLKNQDPIYSQEKLLQNEKAGFFHNFETTKVGRCMTSYDLTSQTESEKSFRVSKVIDLTRCDILTDWKSQVERDEETEFKKFTYLLGISQDQTKTSKNRNIRGSYITKYNMTGTSNQFLIQSATTEGQMMYSPYGPASGEATTFMYQHLEFQRTESKSMKGPSKPQKTNLVSRLVTKEMKDGVHDVYNWREESKNVDIKRINVILRIVNELSDTKDLMKDEYIDKFVWLQDALKDLTSEEIRQLITEINSQCVDLRLTSDNVHETNKVMALKLIVEALSQLGSIPMVKSLQPLINDKLIHDTYIQYIISGLTIHHIPTKDTINILMSLLRMNEDKVSDKTKNQINLVLGSLTRRLCTTEGQSKVHPIDNCDQEVIDNVMSLFYDQLKNSESNLNRIILLKSISNSRLFDSRITEFIKQTIREKSVSESVRVEAIYTLRGISEKKSELVRSILLPLFRDHENTPAELRIAAFDTLMTTKPKAEMLLLLTSDLNEESSKQVGNYIHSYLRNILELPTIYESETVLNLTRTAQQILPFAKRFEDGLFFSKNLKFVSNSLTHQMAKIMELKLVHTPESFLPRSASLHWMKEFMGYSYDLLEAGFRVEGLDKLVASIFGQQGLNADKYSNLLKSLIGGQVSKEVHETNSLLDDLMADINVKPRGREETQGHFFIRSLGYEMGIYAFDDKDVNQFLSNVRRLTGSLLNNGRKQVEWFAVLPSLQEQYKMSSLVGFPVMMESRMIQVVDVKASLETKAEKKSLGLSWNLLVKPRLNMKFCGKVGLDADYFKNYVGFESGVKLETPLRSQLDVNLSKKTIDFKMFLDPQEQRDTDELIKMYHFHTLNHETKWSINTGFKKSMDKKMLRPSMLINAPRVEFDFGKQFLGADVFTLTYKPMEHQNTFRLPLGLMSWPTELSLKYRPEKLQNKATGIQMTTKINQCEGWSSDNQKISWKEYNVIDSQQYPVKINFDGQTMFRILNAINQNQFVELRLQTGVEDMVPTSTKLTVLTHGTTNKNQMMQLYIDTSFEEKKNGWIDAGQERPLDIIVRGQFGATEVNSKKDATDLIAQIRITKSPLQKRFELIDETIEDSDAYKCQRIRDSTSDKTQNWMNVYCTRALFKRSLNTRLETTMFINKEKVSSNLRYFAISRVYPMTAAMLTKYYCPFASALEITPSTETLENRLPSNLKSIVSRKNFVPVEVTLDRHPYGMEFNLTTHLPKQRDSWKLINIPTLISPGYSGRAMYNLPYNRYTDVTSDFFYEYGYGTCMVDHLNNVKTLDNVFYNLTTDVDCEQVLVKDCSAENTFTLSITRKQTSKNSILTVGRALRLFKGQDVLEITPVYDSQTNNRDYLVQINGKSVQFITINGDVKMIKSHGFILSKEDITTSQDTKDSMVVLMVPELGVKVNLIKDFVSVKVPQWYHGVACGLCGDYVGEESREFVGPQTNVFKNSHDFSLSYTKTNDEKCALKKQVDLQNIDQNSDRIVSPQLIHIEVKSPQSNEICRSIEKVARCPSGSKPLMSHTSSITFRCLDIKNLNSQISEEAFLSSSYSRNLDRSLDTQYDERCVRVDIEERTN